MEDNVVDAMKSLGFTASEAKAYVSLLKCQPATGYEVAASSGVPRSAIYTVLKQLEAAGLVNAIQDKPTKYVALPADRFYEFLERRFTGRLSKLRQAMEQLERPAGNGFLWQIQGYNAILDAARDLIANAEDFVAASIWAREASALGDAFHDAQAAGKQVAIFSFTALEQKVGSVFSYGIAEERLQAHWRHKVILIADARRALIGLTERSDDSRAVLTEDPTIVEMALNNLVLDITLFGQRFGVETGRVIESLHAHLAPLDELLAERDAG